MPLLAGTVVRTEDLLMVSTAFAGCLLLRAFFPRGAQYIALVSSIVLTLGVLVGVHAIGVLIFPLIGALGALVAGIIHDRTRAGPAAQLNQSSVSEPESAPPSPLR